MERSCLRCHSDPEVAPAQTVELYGPERSFEREEGEVVSAISIRIPLDEAFAAADRFSLELSAIMVTLLVLLWGGNIFSGFICASCKKIRDDQGYWNGLESCISRHSDVFFSHGICPECMEILFPEVEGDEEKP